MNRRLGKPGLNRNRVLGTPYDCVDTLGLKVGDTLFIRVESPGDSESYQLYSDLQLIHDGKPCGWIASLDVGHFHPKNEGLWGACVITEINPWANGAGKGKSIRVSDPLWSGSKLNPPKAIPEKEEDVLDAIGWT